MSHPYNLVMNKVKEDAKDKSQIVQILQHYPFILWLFKKKKSQWVLWEKKMFLKLAHSK